jgi:hypothetical protein
VFILKEVKVLCFDTLSEVWILKELAAFRLGFGEREGIPSWISQRARRRRRLGERERTRKCSRMPEGFVERNIKHYNMKSKELSSTI